MNDRDLRIFEMVARTGGIGRAASALNTVQSNVTTRMRQLEEELEIELFERHSRGVALTAAGERLRPYAIEILDLLDQARRAAQDDGTPNGRLAIGALESTAALRLAAVLTAYAQAWPNVDLNLATGTTASLIDDVLQLRLDGAFVAGPVTHPELFAQPIFREELVLATAQSISDIAQLNRLPNLKVLVFRAGCSYRQQLETLLAKRGVVALRIQEFGSLDMIIGGVAAGVGVTLMPRALLEPQARQRHIRLHTLRDTEAMTETVFIRRIKSHPSSAMTEFVRMAQHDARKVAAVSN